MMLLIVFCEIIVLIWCVSLFILMKLYLFLFVVNGKVVLLLFVVCSSFEKIELLWVLLLIM